MTHDTDRRWMTLALAYARRGQGRTASNPSVGCVLVQGNRLLAAARTADGGRPHAETLALVAAGNAAVGAAAYVTLEPCAHEGRTPSCARELVKAGIFRVVVACRDPDPRTNGAGIRLLREAGVTVTEGVELVEAQAVNAGFLSRLQRNRPWVIAKSATSIDGRIALANGISQWITGRQARQYGHALRARCDAILVGSNTVRLDNPRLSCRLEGLASHQPLRVVLDRTASLPVQSAVFDGQQPTLRVVGSDAQPPALPGIDILRLPLDDASALDMRQLLEQLAARGISRLLVEGGGKVLAALLRQGFIDEWHWLQAPSVLGSDSLAATGFIGLTDLPQPWIVRQQRLLGHDRLTVLRRSD